MSLRKINLGSADLRNKNLSYVDLSGLDLRGVNLEGSNLRGANLVDSNLKGVNLKYVGLQEADLRYANLNGANLEYSDLSYANLNGADLRSANLRNTCLNNSNQENIIYSHNTIGLSYVCPQKGSFIGYKKACGCIVELLILEDSKRLSGTSRKCRCDKAKVLSIIDIGNGEEIEEVESDYDQRFIYKVGEIVKVDDFDENRWSECSRGIHFFIDRDEAINY